MNGRSDSPVLHRLRVVSYNVHACIGRDGRFHPARIARVLADIDADVIALQEVEDRAYRGRRVSDFLAAELGMHVLRGTTMQRRGGPYGNLLLSKAPPTTRRIHDISVSGREPRGAIEADFRAGTRRLRVVVTHLGLTARERLRQLRRLRPALESDEAEVRVLAGDLNEWRPLASADRLLRRVFGPAPRPRTFPAGAPIFALDRILVSPPASLVGIRTIRDSPAAIASDHLPLLAEILIGGTADR